MSQVHQLGAPVFALLLWVSSIASPAAAQDALGPRSWPWGNEDQIGAANRITRASILEALGQVRHGEVIELSHEIAEGAPVIPGVQPPYVFGMYLTAERSIDMFSRDMGATNRIGVNLERIEMTTHVSTHLDAIGHISIGEEMYGGVPLLMGVLDRGLLHAGIEKAPPFIARAILIDVAALKGVAMLEPGYVIGPKDLEDALEQQGVAVLEGSIVLIHTGASRTYLQDPINHAHSTPGIGLEAARWLSSRSVIAVGADNHAVEVMPPEVEGLVFPVHQHLLVNQGIYLIENMKLDELAERKIFESTVIMLPTRYRGATGSPVRVIALQ